MNPMTMQVYTIGHSNHSMEEFILLLRRNGVDAVADVRSQPYSRHQPQFNKTELQKELKAAGIVYTFLGRELGARSDNPNYYCNGKVRFDLLAKDVHFKNGIERVLKGIGKYHVALMCAEKDPLDCHRTVLVGHHLQKLGVELLNILADGSTEPQVDTERRMLAKLKIPDVDMFRSREEILEDAYARRSQQIAYEDEGFGGQQP